MAWIALGTAAVAAAGKAAQSDAMASALRPVPAMNPSGFFDNSGWTVATGSGRASASRTDYAPSPDQYDAGLSRYIPWLVLGVVVIAWTKKKG